MASNTAAYAYAEAIALVSGINLSLMTSADENRQCWFRKPSMALQHPIFTMEQQISCRVRDEGDVYIAIGHGRDLSIALGFGEADRTRIEIVILELTRNILHYADSGMILLTPLHEGERRGLAIEARDTGPGIADIELALRDGFSTARSLGAGLPGVKRLMDAFEIESTVGAGTMVRAVKWVKVRNNRRQAVGERM
jgi:anti-sigma regulatory factor (Ser/Thr protein kinase)